MSAFDLVIRNARIVDGTGSPWFRGDLGVEGHRIAWVGHLPPSISAPKVIDAKDRILCPGFIDIHTHSDFLLLRDSSATEKLRQGVTTQGIGQCGFSPAPLLSEENIALLDQYAGFIKAGSTPEWNWRSFGEWLDVLERLPLGTNIAAFFGHGTLRIAVMGFDARTPQKDELDRMKNLAAQSMEEGAFGMTSGLVYPPGVYSQFDEIVALCEIVGVRNGLYESHMRSESDHVVESVAETVRVAELSNIPVQISHHKAAGRRNWGKVHETLRLVEEARNRGLDVTVNQYPYTAASTTLRSILPPWVHEGGLAKSLERLGDMTTRRRILQEILEESSWENYLLRCGGAQGITVLSSPRLPEYEGKNLEEVGAAFGKHPIDAAMDLIVANKGEDTACYDMMSEEDVRTVLQHPRVMVASDSIPGAPGARTHPRTQGTNPRILGRYVREEKVLSLENALWKMTGFPAARLGLSRKGILRPGMDADLVLFDPDTVLDGASYADPLRPPRGIDYVIVNGDLAVAEGNVTGTRSGKVLRKESTSA
jgi:N-acyl-D-amino-acid deacylase